MMNKCTIKKELEQFFPDYINVEKELLAWKSKITPATATYMLVYFNKKYGTNLSNIRNFFKEQHFNISNIIEYINLYSE